MRDLVFVDTSAFIAQAIEADQYHDDARLFWSSLTEKPDLLTTNLVISETFTLIRRWAGYAKAVAFLSYVQDTASGGRMTVIWPTEDAAEAVIRLVAQYPDQELSYCDVLSLVICKRHPNVRSVFTFDHHLGLTGLAVVPGLVRDRKSRR
jgi:predicted nucleic acid-binding protein